MDEKLIQNYMKSLNLTRNEAIQLIVDDLEVDKMDNKEVNSDLTTEQREASKKARQSDRAKNKKPTERVRKENPQKREIIQLIAEMLKNSDHFHDNVQITNIEREIIFFADDETKYKIVVSAPRT